MRRTDWKTHRLPKSGRVLTVGALSVKAANPGTAQVFAILREAIRLKLNNPDYPHHPYRRTAAKPQENCPAEPRRDNVTRRHLGTGSG
jgi:phage tail protein X